MAGVRLPFADRASAGGLLADALVGLDLGPDPIVLGIPRGGVPVAAVVAERLGLTLDVLVAHKIGAPYQPELAIGAVAANGTRIIDRLAREVMGEDDLERAVNAELERARQRERDLRGERPALVLTGRGVLLVDDGIAVGSTLAAAVSAARQGGAARVVVGVPVASVDGAARIRAVADELVALATPEWFMGVGEWYEDFGQVSDEEVRRLLERAVPAKASGQATEPLG